MAYPKIKLADDSGNEVGVTSNRLDVNAYLSATPTIDIGDVSLLLGGTAASVDNGTADATTLRVTVASNAPFIQREDSSHSTAEYGVMALAVRNDTLAALSGSDGDYAPLQVSDIGGLFVTGSQKENVATVSELLLIGGRYDSSARVLDNGDAGAVALNASGHMLIDVVDGGQLDALLDTIKVDTEAIETAVEILDNAISGSEMQVDVVAALPSGSNTIGVVDLGSTDNAVLDAIAASLALLDNSIASGNELQVDVVAALPAGTNAIGKLSANSGVDIGDVDVTSTVQPAGYSTIGHGNNTAVSNSASERITAVSTACKHIDIMAATANTGIIYVGGSGVTSATGVALYAGDVYSADIDDLSEMFVISSVDGEDVQWVYYV